MAYVSSAKGKKASAAEWICLLIACLAMIVFGFLYSQENRYCKIATVSSIKGHKATVVTVSAKIDNISNIRLCSTDHYYLGGKIYGAKDEILGELPRIAIDVERYGHRNYAVRIPLPAQKGQYRVIIDVIKDGEYWLLGNGDKRKATILEVEE